tara:strand:- start:1870 stop:2385 length:516 start_codon:yes stop_codon:yes gene_type:complete
MLPFSELLDGDVFKIPGFTCEFARIGPSKCCDLVNFEVLTLKNPHTYGCRMVIEDYQQDDGDLLMLMEQEEREVAESKDEPIEMLEGYGDTVCPGDEVEVYLIKKTDAEPILEGRGIIKDLTVLADGGDIGMSIDYIESPHEPEGTSHCQLSGAGTWRREFKLLKEQGPPF